MSRGWQADRRLVLSPDGSRVLAPDEPQTGTLLAPEGREVDEATCRRYGLGPYAGGQAPAEGAPAAEPEQRGVGVKTPRGARRVRGKE